MKKYLLIMLAVVLLFSAGCSRVDNGGEASEDVTASEAPGAVRTAESTEPAETAAVDGEGPSDSSPEDRSALTCCAYAVDANGGADAYAAVNEAAEEIRLWALDSLVRDGAEAPEALDIEFDGRTYYAEYRGSSRMFFCSPLICDEYTDGEWRFEVDRASGRLLGMTLESQFGETYADDENAKPDLADPTADAEAIALSFAEKLVGDTSGYERVGLMVSDPYQNWEEKPDYPEKYIYTFARKVLGEETMDRFEVCVNSKGTLLMWRLYDIGAFDPASEGMSRFEGVDIDAVITEKLNGILGRSEEGYASLEMLDRRFCISPADGSIVMFVYARIPESANDPDRGLEIYFVIK